MVRISAYYDCLMLSPYKTSKTMGVSYEVEGLVRGGGRGEMGKGQGRWSGRRAVEKGEVAGMKSGWEKGFWKFCQESDLG